MSTARFPFSRAASIALTLLIALPLLVASLATPAAADTQEDPVVFIGMPGLAWSDISPENTPAMLEVMDDAVGSLSVRSVRRLACPLDGWLALNSSSRAAGESSRCRTLTDPQGGAVLGWEEINEAVQEQNYSASLGVLADALTESDISALPIGPGAGIALADADGNVGEYQERRRPSKGLSTQVEQALDNQYDLLLIDAGSVGSAPRNSYSSREQYRDDQLRILNRRLDAILDGVTASGKSPTIIFAALGDDGDVAARVFAITGEGIPHGVITSPSTRQPGYTLTTDLQATVLDALGLEVAHEGNPVYVKESTAPTSELIADEVDRELQSRVLQPPIIPTYFFIMVAVNVALYAAVAIGLKRPNISKLNAWFHRRTRKIPAAADGTWLPPRTNVLRIARVVALSVACLPLASYLANIVPWWRAAAPGLALTGIIIAIIAVLVTITLIGPWRDSPLAPATIIAGILAVTLAVDVAVGSPLQLGAVMGNPPVVAGRWYGMNNTAFAQFTTSMILLAIAAAQPFIRRNHRWTAAGVIFLFGVVTAFIDGAPTLGADFGGPPAILPAFLILALLAAGLKVRWKHVTAVFLGTALVVIGIAFIDWLRPASSRSHIGNFFQQVLDGELLIVIWRKLDANLRILMGNRPLTILSLSAVALVVFVLARPIRTEINEPSGGQYSWLSASTPIKEVSTHAPLLGSGLIAAAILAALGMGLNDSGIAIPANVAAVLVPALIAATATWMLGLKTSPEEIPDPQDEPAQ